MIGSRVSQAAVLALCSASLTGCFLWTTRGEGNELREEAEERDRRVETLEKGMRADREELQQKLAQLEEVLQQATKVVTRNSADLGLEVERLRAQLSTLEGQIAEVRNRAEATHRDFATSRSELERRITIIARKAGVDVTLSDSEIPADRGQHYNAGQSAFDAGQWSLARSLFREYVSRYPQDERADDAQYRVGAAFLREDQSASALGAFRKVITDYPQSDSVDEALFDMADAFYRLHACTDARTALEALIQGQPRSPLVGRARTKLRQVQSAPAGYCTS